MFDLGLACADDPSLIPTIFRAYDRGQLRCVQTSQKLIDIALDELDFRRGRGGIVKSFMSLAALVKHWLGEILEKDDTYRLRYAALDGVPIDAWPPEARDYALKDARKTFEVRRAQVAWAAREHETAPGKGDGVLPNDDEQQRAAFALHLIASWGIRTDHDGTARLKSELEEEGRLARESLRDSGIYREDGTKDMSRLRQLVRRAWILKLAAERPDLCGGLSGAALEAASAVPEDESSEAGSVYDGIKLLSYAVPRTPTGQVKTDEETLLNAGDPDLAILAKSSAGAKLLSTYVPILERGHEVPITSRPNVLVATGRTSWSEPNWQNPPRKGGIRELLIPRLGNVFVGADYDTLELRCLAQAHLDLLGKSKMAEALNAGRDLHLEAAAELLKISYAEAEARRDEEDIQHARQLSKCMNFGLPGGMGVDRFVDYLKANGVTGVDVNQALRMIASWRAAWPEMDDYFQWVQNALAANGGTLRQLRSGRFRGGCGFTDGANTLFQGLAADGAKEALWRVARAQHCEPGSGLYGTRTVLFLHDEIVIEAPELRAHEAAEELVNVMVAAMQVFVPDVLVKASPYVTRRWYKGAKEVRVGGRLVPARPEKSTGVDGKEKVRWVVDL